MADLRLHVSIARTHFNETFVHVPPGAQIGDTLFLAASKWSVSKNPLLPPDDSWTLVQEILGSSWTSAVTADYLIHRIWMRVATAADVAAGPGQVGARVDVPTASDPYSQEDYGLMLVATDGSLHAQLGQRARYEDEHPYTGAGLTTTTTTRQLFFVMARNLNSNELPVITIPPGQPLQTVNAEAYGAFAITGVESGTTTAGPHLAATTKNPSTGMAYWSWYQLLDSLFEGSSMRPAGTVAPYVTWTNLVRGRWSVIMLAVSAPSETPQAPVGPSGSRFISWTPPAHTGGSPLQAYRAFVILPDGSRSWWEFPPEVTSGYVIGDTGYVFVTARNAQGESFPSNILPPMSAGAVTETVQETV